MKDRVTTFSNDSSNLLLICDIELIVFIITGDDLEVCGFSYFIGSFNSMSVRINSKKET